MPEKGNTMSGVCAWCGEDVTGVRAMPDKTLVICAGRAHWFKPARGVTVRFERNEDELPAAA
jgi:hypothetical protein